MAEPTSDVRSFEIPGSTDTMVMLSLGKRGEECEALGMCPGCFERVLAQLEEPLTGAAIERVRDSGLPDEAVVRLLMIDIALVVLKMYQAGRLPKVHPHEDLADGGGA